MVEPLLHFVLPFTSLKACGVDSRKALFASVIALTPDFDVFFHVHRSLSHSILVIGLILLPIIALTYRRRSLRNLTIIGTFGIFSHLALDLFTGYTPLLWPVLNESLWISTSLNIQLGSPPILIPSLKLLIRPNAFYVFQTWLAPLATTAGLGISIILLAPIFAAAWRQHLSN